MIDFQAQLDLRNTAEGKALESGYDYYVTKQKHPNIFWDPGDARWENYRRDRFVFSRTSLPQQKPYDSWPFLALCEVLYTGKVVRASGGSAIWDPRDGYWYRYVSVQENPPQPLPEPDWVKKMNQDLAAIDRANLTPEERARARTAIIDKYT